MRKDPYRVLGIPHGASPAVVLEAYAPTVPGFFLYFPSRAQRSPALRLFVDTAKELLPRAK